MSDVYAAFGARKRRESRNEINICCSPYWTCYHWKKSHFSWGHVCVFMWESCDIKKCWFFCKINFEHLKNLWMYIARIAKLIFVKQLQAICRRGGDWFASFGRPRNTGTKVCFNLLFYREVGNSVSCTERASYRNDDSNYLVWRVIWVWIMTVILYPCFRRDLTSNVKTNGKLDNWLMFTFRQ